MLVLSRLKDQGIVLSDVSGKVIARVSVAAIQKSDDGKHFHQPKSDAVFRAKIGIEAPADVIVSRDENFSKAAVQRHSQRIM